MVTNATPRLAALADQYLALIEQRHVIDERLEEIKAAIRDIVPEPIQIDTGRAVIAVSRNRRFNENKALALIPEIDLDTFTYPQTRVNKERLKTEAPGIFEQAQEEFLHKVSVRLPS